MLGRLTYAALLDATAVALKPVRVIGFLASLFTASTICRIRGHNVRIVALPEVTRLCVRCGVEGAR